MNLRPSGQRPLVLAGPTGTGKTSLALAIAERLEGELVCADSRQIYEGMVIGTAAPEAEDLARAPHHGFCVLDPLEVYAAGRFIEETDARCAEVRARGGLPILVGGTGLYLRAWRYGLDDVPRADDEVRARLQARLDAHGAPALHARLNEVDPETASRVAPTDPVRILRALEVFEMTGEKASTLRQTHLSGPPRVEATWLLLDAPLDWIADRLRQRAAAMFDRGLTEEALALCERVGPEHRLVKTMGYEEALALADGVLPSREEAIRLITKRHRLYAKRQRTWFKKEPWWTRWDVREPVTAEAVVATLPSSS